jgi:hypothetical protein
MLPLFRALKLSASLLTMLALTANSYAAEDQKPGPVSMAVAKAMGKLRADDDMFGGSQRARQPGSEGDRKTRRADCT